MPVGHSSYSWYFPKEYRTIPFCVASIADTITPISEGGVTVSDIYTDHCVIRFMNTYGSTLNAVKFNIIAIGRV